MEHGWNEMCDALQAIIETLRKAVIGRIEVTHTDFEWVPNWPWSLWRTLLWYYQQHIFFFFSAYSKENSHITKNTRLPSSTNGTFTFSFFFCFKQITKERILKVSWLALTCPYNVYIYTVYKSSTYHGTRKKSSSFLFRNESIHSLVSLRLIKIK